MLTCVSLLAIRLIRLRSMIDLQWIYTVELAGNEHNQAFRSQTKLLAFESTIDSKKE